MKLWAAILVVAFSFSSLDAEAKRRMGGGGSFGKQSTNVTQRDSAPTAPAAPAQNSAASAAKPGTPAAAPAAAAPKKPWGAMLGGLAAGLGLAWLASSLGLGEAFGNILMFALLAMGALMLFGMFMRSRANKNAASDNGYAYQGAGAGSVKATDAVTARQYSPNNVGNDASARPWEGNTTAFDSGKSMIGSGLSSTGAGASALSGSQSWGIPADFDITGFLNAAKRNFVTLQDAWDKSDMVTLRGMMTDEMADEIKSQLAEQGASPNTEKTDVAMLDAQLLGIEETANEYMASVEFSGMIREDGAVSPAPFREVWNMTKAKSGGGWLVAGVQAMQ